LVGKHNCSLTCFHGIVATERLTELELELLELCMSPETTTTLHEEMLESPLDRRLVESALRGLVERGLMLTYRGVYGGVHRPREGPPEDRVYEDDWWELTAAGHEAMDRA
jgi:hypothetical protein